ncbi:MAG: hypothetical protein ABI068_07090 [Ktedonobacterales bacterium]
MLEGGRIRWSPRVQPAKLRKLYQRDALGIPDKDLIDDVGFTLYARCQSILTVTEAASGRVHCPGCEQLILRQGARDDGDDLLHCDACGWEMPWEQYHRSWQHQELCGGGAVDAFSSFVKHWPRAHTPQQKMLLIDELIHVWHWQTREDHLLGRPSGVNLIEGSRRQALALLDELTYGPGSDAQLLETRQAWQEMWWQVKTAHQTTDRK